MSPSPNSFLIDFQDYLEKAIAQDNSSNNAVNCGNSYKAHDHSEEKEVLRKIREEDYGPTTEQGDLLELLLKKLFNRITLISSVSITNKDSILGQIDVKIITLDETFYDVLGLIQDYPLSLIGECKNYKKERVSRPEIEKMCWRSCKGRALSFFIGNGYKQTAIKEVEDFNLNKERILKDCRGVYIVPITLDMVDTVVSNELNFFYFIRWALRATRENGISSYL